jgi:hypothetical protein
MVQASPSATPACGGVRQHAQNNECQQSSELATYFVLDFGTWEVALKHTSMQNKRPPPQHDDAGLTQRNACRLRGRAVPEATSVNTPVNL